MANFEGPGTPPRYRIAALFGALTACGFVFAALRWATGTDRLIVAGAATVSLCGLVTARIAVWLDSQLGRFVSRRDTNMLWTMGVLFFVLGALAALAFTFLALIEGLRAAIENSVSKT